MTNIIIITTVIVFFGCAILKIMGGADAWALIFITVYSITTPFDPILDNVLTGIGVSTYINALIISFIGYPIYNLIMNYHKGAEIDSPWYYLLFARRYETRDVLNSFGYIVPGDSYITFKDFITNGGELTLEVNACKFGQEGGLADQMVKAHKGLTIIAPTTRYQAFGTKYFGIQVWLENFGYWRKIE
jgi:hypothetical protein